MHKALKIQSLAQEAHTGRDVSGADEFVVWEEATDERSSLAGSSCAPQRTPEMTAERLYYPELAPDALHVR